MDNQEGEDVFRPSSNYFDYLRHGGTEEEVKTGGSQFWSNTVQKLGSGDGSPKVLDFSKFRNSLGKNYSYFSAKTGLLQSHTLELLTWDGGGVRIIEEYLREEGDCNLITLFCRPFQQQLNLQILWRPHPSRWTRQLSCYKLNSFV